MFPNTWLQDSICKAADTIVLQAPGLTDRLLSYASIPRERIRILSNSFDAVWWASGEFARRSPRENDMGLRLLSTGGIGRAHGIFALTETLLKLRELGNSVHLTVLGQWGPFVKSDVLKLIQVHELGDSLSFPGRVSRASMRELFQTSDLCIYQCAIDGSPRSVLEATGAGIPVIASEHPGVNILDLDREFIGFTKLGDVDRIVELVEDYRINRSEWLARAKRGQQRVALRFCTSAVAKDFISFYDSLQQHEGKGTAE
jgi:glycosyltransferase involved in cell wall biosynthesis